MHLFQVESHFEILPFLVHCYYWFLINGICSNNLLNSSKSVGMIFLPFSNLLLTKVYSIFIYYILPSWLQSHYLPVYNNSISSKQKNCQIILYK